jgi:hypothetical protein
MINLGPPHHFVVQAHMADQPRKQAFALGPEMPQQRLFPER